MVSSEDSQYRLRLAEGFLGEARQDVDLGRWRSCVDNSQLAAENAAEAVLALLGPVARSHGAAELLRREQEAGTFSEEGTDDVQRLIEVSDQLGWDVHIASDYGDEAERRTPWEMFDENAARRAVAAAEEAVRVARTILETGSSSSGDAEEPSDERSESG